MDVRATLADVCSIRSHAYLNDSLLLRGEVLLHVLLQSSQHHGLQNALEFLNLSHKEGVQFSVEIMKMETHKKKKREEGGASSYLFLSFKVSKFSHKRLLRWEPFRLQEVQQAEELFHSVLKRSSCQQNFVLLQVEGGTGRVNKYSSYLEDHFFFIFRKSIFLTIIDWNMAT